VPKKFGTAFVIFKPSTYSKTQDSYGINSDGDPEYFGWYEPNNGRDGYYDSSWYWENAETLWSCIGDASSFWLVVYTGQPAGDAIKYFGDEDPYPDQDVGSDDDEGSQSADESDATYYAPNATLPTSGYDCYDYILYWTDSSGYHEQDLGNYCWAI
jgi:hypothetical protein